MADIQIMEAKKPILKNGFYVIKIATIKSSVASWDLSSREGPPQVRWNRGLYKRGEERVSFSFMGL